MQCPCILMPRRILTRRDIGLPMSNQHTGSASASDRITTAEMAGIFLATVDTTGVKIGTVVGTAGTTVGTAGTTVGIITKQLESDREIPKE